MSTFGMVGSMKTAPENRDKLVSILIQAANLMKDQEGCQHYIVSKDENDESLTWVVEFWTSKAAHDTSLQMPEVRALISEAMPLLIGSPSGATLQPVQYNEG